jgi:hypothetical protein
LASECRISHQNLVARRLTNERDRARDGWVERRMIAISMLALPLF